MSDELNELGLPKRERARNQFSFFIEEYDPDLVAAVFRIFPDPVAVLPSIKYGEHRWGAFA